MPTPKNKQESAQSLQFAASSISLVAIIGKDLTQWLKASNRCSICFLSFQTLAMNILTWHCPRSWKEFFLQVQSKASFSESDISADQHKSLWINVPKTNSICVKIWFLVSWANCVIYLSNFIKSGKVKGDQTPHTKEEAFVLDKPIIELRIPDRF